MAAKDKTPKPKMKVEEVEEPELEAEEAFEKEDIPSDAKTPEEDLPPEPPKAVTEKVEVKEPEAEPEPEKTSILEPPKVASFSQLDTSKPEEVKSDADRPSDTTGESEVKSAPDEKPESTADTGEKEEPKGDVSSDEIKEWLKEVRPDTTKEVEKSGGPNLKVMVMIVLALLVVGAIVGGFFYYRQSVTQPPESELIETQSPTPTPTAVPVEEVDLKTYSVSVLNGSGVTGEAGRVKSLLTGGGFADEKVTAGNADASNYTSTTVSLKEDTPEAVFDALVKVLGETYDVVKSEEALDKDSTYDVIVIVGQKK